MKTAYEVLKDSGKLERNVIAAKVNGEVVDLTTPVEETAEATVTPLTFDDDEGKKVFWHTSSHVLAAAVKRLYPDVKLTIGPAIETGFYYDFDAPTGFTEEMLKAIEKEMQKIVHENAKEER
ncbi:MAG: threonine--tRNA ligase, partial [Thermoguttaceae bacterium]